MVILQQTDGRVERIHGDTTTNRREGRAAPWRYYNKQIWIKIHMSGTNGNLKHSMATEQHTASSVIQSPGSYGR